MKLSVDRARQLGRFVWRDRLRRFLPIAAAGLAIVGGLAFMLAWRLGHTDRTVAAQAHDATVLSVKTTTSRGITIFHVHLDDGRDVDALSRLRQVPAPGTRVVISESHHESGRLTWDVVRVVDR